MTPKQLDIFDQPKSFGTPPKHMVRRTDPGTSIEAACAIDSAGVEEIVYNTIKSFGDKGCIGDDVHGALPHMGIQTLSPRYKPLLKKGLIEETGEKRKALSGRNQRVIRAVK